MTLTYKEHTRSVVIGKKLVRESLAPIRKKVGLSSVMFNSVGTGLVLAKI